jgi:hypothetical protein
VLHISKKDEQQRLEQEANEARQAAEAALQRAADTIFLALHEELRPFGFRRSRKVHTASVVRILS